MNQIEEDREEEVRYLLNSLIQNDPPKFPKKTPPVIKHPTHHKATILIWSDLKANNIGTLSSVNSTEEIQEELSRLFDLEDYKENKRSSILIDFYTYAVQFARENCFNPEQTSAFFSILKRTNDICIETPFGNFEECLNFFKESLICHTVRRPPFSIDLFSMKEARKIVDYALNNYFRNYKLYKYVFTPKVSMDLRLIYHGLPPTPPPEQTSHEDDKSPIEATSNINNATAEHTEENAESSKLEGQSKLKTLIRKHLTDELKTLRLSVEEQIKQAEEEICRRIDIPEAAKTVTSKPEKSTKGKERKNK